MATSISALMGGGIKSVQRGISTPSSNTTGASLDITIAPVNPAKTLVNLLTVSQEEGSGYRRQISLVNATTLRIFAYKINVTSYPASYAGLETSWEVVEFS